jgi:hypothetical protein
LLSYTGSGLLTRSRVSARACDDPAGWAAPCGAASRNWEARCPFGATRKTRTSRSLPSMRRVGAVLKPLRTETWSTYGPRRYDPGQPRTVRSGPTVGAGGLLCRSPRATCGRCETGIVPPVGRLAEGEASSAWVAVSCREPAQELSFSVCTTLGAREWRTERSSTRLKSTRSSRTTGRRGCPANG